MNRRKILLALMSAVTLSYQACDTGAREKRLEDNGTKATVWSAEKAKDWYAKNSWINGANFIPSTAINQLEMWQKETFDTATISKELGWASGIGFNTMRVYLHHKAWENDQKGFRDRVDTYLDIAGRNGISTIFVFFDDCWNKDPKAGLQPQPRPGVHNSGWMQDPGDPYYKDTTLYAVLEKYVKDVMGHLANDERVLMWDLYNEPGNSGKKDSSLPLLKKVFQWGRDVNPTQPLTAGLWDWNFHVLNEFQLHNSDVITYHDYEDEMWHKRVLNLLKIHGKPLVCTEYMARTRNSYFTNILPMLKKENIGAINWGLVAGKSNTIYAWDTPVADGSEPKIWFHDIFRKDGSVYDEKEVQLIKELNKDSR
ncbi:glycoside hydrolase family 2 TIM barrel-domain containing protein [Flavihumibacter solisilvae]|uniref:1,4-beta-xylanase n=1 Tax=Flavihumibacter solisilvae TaxID=1349421 RepID=A0A0C1L5C5_9BACT|nr:glycoside hydrolase family 2 TIM barrel-domain containing protein [Flavihumibacter solisilvae]KIC95312.1 1,4-beta-xylanase [Flavihumibacter solisilvae]